MSREPEANDDRIFDELQELVAIEVKEIMATAAEEGFAPRDVVSALELALQAEIEALADGSDPVTERRQRQSDIP
jgi:hypothetical protein